MKPRTPGKTGFDKRIHRTGIIEPPRKQKDIFRTDTSFFVPVPVSIPFFLKNIWSEKNERVGKPKSTNPF